MIKVTPIQTGTVRIKASQATGKPNRSALGRKIDLIRDPVWLNPLPIYAFLIEHPDGRFLVDTGDSARNSEPGYFPWWHPFFQFEVSVNVAPEEEVGPQLKAMGINPASDLEAVLMTHLHHDHAGGLAHFPHSRIIVPREGWNFSRGVIGKLAGCLPQRWPPWFKPELIDLEGPAIGPFDCSHSITRDGRISFVPTPGHLKGHVSVVIKDDDFTYFIVADATYRQSNLQKLLVDGITMDPELSLSTLKKVKSYSLERPTIVLPSHDPDGPERLNKREVFTADAKNNVGISSEELLPAPATSAVNGFSNKVVAGAAVKSAFIAALTLGGLAFLRRRDGTQPVLARGLIGSGFMLMLINAIASWVSRELAGSSSDKAR